MCLLYPHPGGKNTYCSHMRCKCIQVGSGTYPLLICWNPWNIFPHFLDNFSIATIPAFKEKRGFIYISRVRGTIHVLVVTLSLQVITAIGLPNVTVVCSVRISTTWLICIGLLDLQVIAYCLNHSRSSLSQVIPSGARYLCLLWAIYLCEKIFSLKEFPFLHT